MKKGPPKTREHHGKARTRFPREVAVLYEDDAVIALNKPPGLLAVPIKGSDAPSALSLVAAHLKPQRQRAWTVHRIDRFSSGILLFAKTSEDRDDLVKQFLSHTPIRRYLAVVRGNLEADAGTLVHYFRKEGMVQRLSAKKDSRADRAELRYVVERRLNHACLVRVELTTGFQNQIRAQFAAIGHPVIGDRKYHPAEANETLIDRVALHAAHLEFIHPRSGETVSIDCDPPKDFEYLVRKLPRSR